MYVENNLLKYPPYLFQVAGSKEDQVIYRTFLSDKKQCDLFPRWMDKNNFTGDSYGDSLCEKFYVDLIIEQSQKIDTYRKIKKYFYQNNFSAKVTLKKFKNYIFQLEFPINHINILENKESWQIKTGPILFPAKKIDKINIKSLIPSFVHFNNFKFLDIAFDYPFMRRNGFFKRNNIYKSVNGDIELFFS